MQAIASHPGFPVKLALAAGRSYAGRESSDSLEERSMRTPRNGPQAIAGPRGPAGDASWTCLSRRRLAGYSLLVAVVCAAALLGTSPALPMVWDEGNAIGRAQGILSWIEAVGGRAKADADSSPWSREGVASHWRYTTQVEGHPTLYGMVIAAGIAISAGWLAPLESCRLGPIVLLAVAAGCMFYRMTRTHGLAAGLGAVAALLLLPRVFSHAHFASFDGPLTAAWVIAWAAFAPALRSRLAAAAWGVALGLTLSSKATGWFAPVPFVLWALAYRERAAARALAIGIPTALAVFYLLNPPLWHAPLQGMAAFVHLNTHRGFDVPIQFLGRVYDLGHPLPWYNTLLWTAITVPLGTLALALVGVSDAVRRWREDRMGVLLLGHWAVLLVVRALPIAPPHDGVRLFLPSFAFLAALSGVGVAAVLRRAGAQTAAAPLRPAPAARGAAETVAWPQKYAARRPLVAAPRPRVAAAAIALLYACSAGSLVWNAPQWLSYYNVLIGGLSGATAAGMEPTYYWDALDRSVLDWLARNTAEHEKVLFSPCSFETLALLRAWGTLSVEFLPDAPGRWRWYVLQHRPGMWTAADRWLVAHCRPAWRKVLRPGGWGPWRLDVPLIEIYAFEDYRAALADFGRAAEQERNRSHPREQ